MVEMSGEKQLRDWDSVCNPKRFLFIPGTLWEETLYPEDSNSLQQQQPPQNEGTPDARLDAT